MEVFDASRARLTGTRRAPEGHITGFERDGDRATWTVRLPAGLHLLRIRFRTPHGEKGFDLVVDGVRRSGRFPGSATFRWHPAGRFETRGGTVEIAVEKGWGYFDIDAIEVVPAPPPPPLRPVRPRLVDPAATAEAKALMRRLTAGYGRRCLSGQYDPADNDHVRKTAGVTPAVFGADLMPYSPTRRTYGEDPKNLTEAAIARAKAGQILTLSWHWNAPRDLIDATYTDASGKRVEAPWWRGFYTDASRFDVAAALADPKGDAHACLLRDIDAIAVELKKIQAARVPVLWRPLHEAEGRWFWWGAKGPEPFKALWRLLFDRLTRLHGLHNLVWVFTSGRGADWYPGDAFVDVVGADLYPADPRDPLTEDWEALLARHDGEKPIALTEIGGVPDIERMRRFGVRWAYFVSWSGDQGARKVSADTLRRIYRSAAVRNR